MVLIINRSRKDGNAAVEIFRYMGVLARAETPECALSEISMMYRAVLIMNPHKLPAEKDYIKALRSYAGNTPVFAMSDGKISDETLYDMTFADDITSARLLKSISEYCEKGSQPTVGEYMLAGINASIHLGGVTYYNEVIPFTKTETMILRLLIRTYPSPISPKRILKYAFNQSKQPEEAGVRTHVSSINKKFRAVSGRNLICSSDTDGYVILTPLLKYKYSLSAT